MNDLAQLITALATLVAAIASFIVSMRNSRKIEEVRHNTNSLAAQLLTEGKAASNAEGRAEGLQQGRDESNASK